MWPYWIMFLLPAAAAIMQPTRPWAQQAPANPLKVGPVWAAVAFLAALVIGLRHEVGGDWVNYLDHLREVEQMPLSDVLTRAEPAYWFIAWLVADLNDGVYVINLVLATIFSTGLVVFCRAQPRPWLAAAIAVPYLVVVLGMGYTRQGVALSLAMIGLVALSRKNTFAFVAWVAAGALFHRTAIVLIPLGALVTSRNKWWTVLWLGAAAVAFYDVLLREQLENLQQSYLEAEYQSEGALVRVMMNVLPAVLLLMHHRRFPWNKIDRSLWTTQAVLALATAAWLAVSPSSTAVDRIALYLIPLQLYVFTRLPDLATRNPEGRRVWVGLILVYYGTVQFVWLFFATHSIYWVPYRFYLFRDA